MMISEVSEKYDLSVDTLRYYERVRLIPRVHRNASGIRDWWVEFIKCMRGAGLPIAALTEYVALFQQGEETVEARLELLKEQRDLLVERITDMQDTLERLNYKIERYDRVLVPVESKLAEAQQEADGSS